MEKFADFMAGVLYQLDTILAVLAGAFAVVAFTLGIWNDDSRWGYMGLMAVFVFIFSFTSALIRHTT